MVGKQGCLSVFESVMGHSWATLDEGCGQSSKGLILSVGRGEFGAQYGICGNCHGSLPPSGELKPL